MADNVGYTPGSGAQIAADEIGGVLHQRTKVQFGEDGSATDVSEVNPLPVTASGASTEATQVELLSEAIMLLSQIAAGLPRLTTTKQASVSIEAISSGLTLTTVNSVSNIALIGNRYGNAADMAMAGTHYIYNNIQVS